MSEANPSASPERAFQPPPGSGGPGRKSFRDTLKEIRAGTRVNESSRTSNFSQYTHRSPISATFVTQESSPTTQSNERRSSQAPIQLPSRNSPSQAQATPPRPPTAQEPNKVNGLSLGQQVIRPQPSFPPQPQIYMTPEQQSRFMVRPMAVPYEVPLAVRTSQNGQYAQMPQSYVPYVSEIPHAPKTASLTPCGLGVNEHTIGLAMNSRVRDQYTSVINNFRKPIEDFMNSELPREASVQEVKKLLDRINLITTHPDLDMQEAQDEFSQPSPEDEAGWAIESSFKFKFLNQLFTNMRNDAVHISIVARPGRTLDIIETFLKGRGFAYFRPDGRRSSSPNDQCFAGCRLQVSIVPSGPEGMNLVVQPAALVIAFDGSFNVRDIQALHMRTQPGIEWIMPAVHLLVYKSAEHITRCIDVQMDETSRLRRIISCMTQLRHDVGKLPPEDMPASAAADEVSIFLRLNGHQIKWSMPPIRSIPLDILESSQDASTQDGSQSSEQEVPIQNSALKRVSDRDPSSTEAAKRQRMSPAGNINNVSDSVTQSTHAQIDHLQRQNAYLTQQNAHLKSQIEHLSTSLTTLRADLTTATRANQNLSSQLSTHATQESHISDLEASLSDLQTRYETKDRAHRDLHLEKSNLVDVLEKANKKLASPGSPQHQQPRRHPARHRRIPSPRLRSRSHNPNHQTHLPKFRPRVRPPSISIRKHLRRRPRRPSHRFGCPPRDRRTESQRRSCASGGNQPR
ncbi:MAG: hypothetical protein Q9225_006910 [Loekoesia sp. 1 TL-2023]